MTKKKIILIAAPLSERGGGYGKGRLLREKKYIFFCSKTYRNILIQLYMLNFVVGQQSLYLLSSLLKYLPRKMTLLDD